MKIKWIVLAVFAAVLVIPVGLMAQDNTQQGGLQHQKAKSMFWTASFGFDFGGDKMVTLEYDDGDESDIRAGELAYINIGMIVPNGKSDFETQVTIGWKFDSSNADNGDVSFYRFPIEVLQFYKQEKFRIGGGITYHLAPSLDGSGVVSYIEADFENALGFVLEGDILFEPLYAGLKITNIEYEVKGYDEKVNGNSFGIVLGVRF